MISRNLRAALLAPLGLLAPVTAQALTFELPGFGDQSIDAGSPEGAATPCCVMDYAQVYVRYLF